MSLTSLKFLAFAATVLAAFRAARPAGRWAVLLGASYLFCAAASPRTAALLLAVSLANFGLGILLENAAEADKPARLFAGAALNVSALVFSKAPATSSFILPLGVSIYVFQAVSYLVDVYLGKIRAERHLGHFLLYLSFFPKFLQGPIERAQDFLPRLKTGLACEGTQFSEGLPLVLIGLFKKIVVADRLGRVADVVFSGGAPDRGLAVLLAIYAFTLQIYFDFAGYTDIARGLARFFGLELSPNFDSPYLATNIQEFWRRWHISLSTWLRDYLFVPLAARLRGLQMAGTVCAALLTFAICGVWHGATWGYLTFGALHGLYTAVSLLTLKGRDRLVARLGLNPQMVLWTRRAVTFHLVAFAFVFFRCPTLSGALALLGRLPGSMNASSLGTVLAPLEIGALALSLLLLAFPRYAKAAAARFPAFFYGALTDAIIVFSTKTNVPFLYNKF